jgi:hypothetical protein
MIRGINIQPNSMITAGAIIVRATDCDALVAIVWSSPIGGRATGEIVSKDKLKVLIRGQF